MALLACSTHGSDALFYCRKCSEHMCTKCLASGSHLDHNVQSLQELYELEHKELLVVQEQVMETIRVIKGLLEKTDGEDVRLKKSYEQTRVGVTVFFTTVQELANDRERTLLKQVDSKQAELVGKLSPYYSKLSAAEKSCQLWLQRQREVIERLKSNDISATGEYNDCITGLKQAEQAVIELHAQLEEILQRPPVITFTYNVHHASELKEAIKSLGEFDKYTTTTFQEPEKVAYYTVRVPGLNKVYDNPFGKVGHAQPELPYEAVADLSDAYMYDQPKNEHQRYKAISTDHVHQPTQYQLPSIRVIDQPACIVQPESVISHFQMKEQQEASSAHPTRACVYLSNIIVLEEGSIRCLQNKKLIKKITKVGRNKLKQPECVTYYGQKEKFLVVDSLSKKLVKVKPDTGKTDEVDLPHIIDPGDIAITTGPTPTIFITDKRSLCVLKYSTNGAYQGTIPLQGFGVKRPAGITYMAGFLYITDIECHCIFKFDTEGVSFEKIGSHGNALGCLNQPYSITALPGEKLAISETGNHRISVFDSDGKFVKCFGGKGRDPGKFNMPKGISADAFHFVVVDYGNRRIQVFLLDAIMTGIVDTYDDHNALYDTVAL